MERRNALILGGHGDIGSAIAQRLNEDGLEVLPVGRDDFDLGDPNSIEAFFSKNNGFDVVVHSGGLNNPKLFENLSEEEIRISLEVNIIGFLHVVRRCLTKWKANQYGRVLAISSLYGFIARGGRLPYVMSKHALNGAVKTLAIELAQDNVLVNSLSPGYIATKMTYKNNSLEVIEGFVSDIPLGRLGTPADLAEVAAFLCSSRNTYITGQDIVVDGGFSIGGFQK